MWTTTTTKNLKERRVPLYKLQMYIYIAKEPLYGASVILWDTHASLWVHMSFYEAELLLLRWNVPLCEAQLPLCKAQLSLCEAKLPLFEVLPVLFLKKFNEAILSNDLEASCELAINCLFFKPTVKRNENKCY